MGVPLCLSNNQKSTNMELQIRVPGKTRGPKREEMEKEQKKLHIEYYYYYTTTLRGFWSSAPDHSRLFSKTCSVSMLQSTSRYYETRSLA